MTVKQPWSRQLQGGFGLYGGRFHGPLFHPGAGAAGPVFPVDLIALAVCTRADIRLYEDISGVIQTAAANVWPIEYRGGVLLGNPVNSLKTNLIAESADFTSGTGYWSRRGTPVISTTRPGPDGNNNATQLTLQGSGVQDIFKAGLVVSSGVEYRPTIFMKRVSTTGTITFTNPHGSTFGDWSINLAGLGTGWNRITADHAAVTVTNAMIGSGANQGGMFMAAASGTLTVDVWGADVQVAGFDTAHIPTVGAAASRAQDIVTVLTSAFPFNTAQGTIFSKIRVDGSGALIGSQRVWSLSDGTVNNRLSVSQNGGKTNSAFFSTDGGSPQANIQTGGGWGVDTEITHSARWKLNDYGFSVDGAPEVPDTTATVPTGLTNIKIGQAWNEARVVEGWIQELTYDEAA